EEQPPTKRREYPLVSQPGPARRERIGQLSVGGHRWRAIERGRLLGVRLGRHSGSKRGRQSRLRFGARGRRPERVSELDGRSVSELSTGLEHRGIQPRPCEASVSASADANQEPSAASPDAGPRGGASGPNQPATGQIRERVARASGKEAG